MDNNNNINNNKPVTPVGPTRKPASPISSFQPSQDFIKSLSLFFQRDVIALPLVKRYAHPSIGQKCGLKTATLELDTATYPNLDYIAGNRLSIYPVNNIDHVNAILKYIVNDLYIPENQKQTSNPMAPSSPRNPTPSVNQPQSGGVRRARLSDPWEFFVQLHGRESIRMALLHIYDITTAPSRELLHTLVNYCSNKDHKTRLNAISGSDETWEKWCCSGLRSLKSCFEEFNSCSIPAKILFAELTLQQPRQYSISNIKSRKRFRTEIVVIQHKFNTKQIGITIQNIKDRESNENSTSAGKLNHIVHQERRDLNREQLRNMKSHPTSVRVSHNEPMKSGRSSASIRSLRSVATFGNSPISSQQVSKVPAYAGKLMSLYASSKSSIGTSNIGSGTGTGSRTGSQGAQTGQQQKPGVGGAGQPKSASSQSEANHEGLCSNYLLNLKHNDHIVCEFVENPRFTLKGNRERPIMMIGQAIGTLAFRAFWQQRALEHDRAQMFYTLFKDLSPKKFGDLHLVNLTGNKCKIEDLFRREITQHLEHKVLSSVLDIDKKLLQNLLDSAIGSNIGSGRMESISSLQIQNNDAVQNNNENMEINNNRASAPRRSPRSLTVRQAVQQGGTQTRSALAQKEIADLGNKLSRLLMDNNGCLYLCCDLAMTQAIEILIVESVVRNHPAYTPDQVIGMLAKWKGNTIKYQHQMLQGAEGKKYLFTLENPFERAQIVEEIYDETT